MVFVSFVAVVVVVGLFRRATREDPAGVANNNGARNFHQNNKASTLFKCVLHTSSRGSHKYGESNNDDAVKGLRNFRSRKEIISLSV